jgi:hypothetical protein
MVTPQLVEAMSPDEVPTNLPGMATAIPSDWEFYSKGHVEVPNCDPSGQLLGPYPGGGPFRSPGPGAMGGNVVPEGAMPAEGVPQGGREMPAPTPGAMQPTAPATPIPQPQVQEQSYRRMPRSSGAVRTTIVSPPAEATRSSRRRPAASESIERLPAANKRPSLQKTSSRNYKPSSPAAAGQKSSPGFIGPTGYDLR